MLLVENWYSIFELDFWISLKLDSQLFLLIMNVLSPTLSVLLKINVLVFNIRHLGGLFSLSLLYNNKEKYIP